MYHISNDKRARRSAERIGNGLLECLKNKSFSEVTVTDVQKASSVGRATFYRLFDNIADVLSYLCDSIFEEVGREYEEMETHEPDITTLTYIKKWMEHKALLKAVVDCNRMDFLYNTHLKYLGAGKAFFFPGADIGAEQMTYLMATMTACTSAFLTAWLKNGAKESAEELRNRLKECFTVFYSIFCR